MVPFNPPPPPRLSEVRIRPILRIFDRTPKNSQPLARKAVCVQCTNYKMYATVHSLSARTKGDLIASHVYVLINGFNLSTLTLHISDVLYVPLSDQLQY